MTQAKIEITERQPQRNAAGKINAYICTIRENGVFAGRFLVPTTNRYTGKAQRSKKAQLEVIMEMIDARKKISKILKNL